jgi:hypothetical protein
MKACLDEMIKFNIQPNTMSYTDPLGDTLKTIIRKLPPDKVTLSGIRDILGQEGLLLLISFLNLIFLIPVSIPGVSTIFGTTILLISVCRLLNRRLWIPKCFHERQLPSEKLRNSLNSGLIWFRRLEHFSHPLRLKLLIHNRMMNVLNNCAMILGAGLLMAPFGLIPFSNTLPALALLFIAVGLLQRDGLYILFGHFTNLVTIVYFMLIISGGGAIVNMIIDRI